MRNLVGSKMITAPVWRCGTGASLCERRGGMGTAGQAMVRGTIGKVPGSGMVNTRDGTIHLTAGRWTVGTETNDGSGPEIAVGNEYHTLSRTRLVPFPSRPHVPVPTLPRVPLVFTPRRSFASRFFLFFASSYRIVYRIMPVVPVFDKTCSCFEH